MEKRFIASLCDVRIFADPTRDLGGKGANLAKLIRLGVPVPHGFCVTTDAFREFVGSARLDETVSDVLGELISLEPFALNKASATIREAFHRASIPPAIEAEVLLACEKQAAEAMAVRSSATAEDLPTASFAGQHESFLNMTTREQVLDAIRKCWSSLWTPRAIAYRARNGIHSSKVAMAVIVQRFVPAVSAGILFTHNPVTGAQDEIVINASFGIAEAVVSGVATPDEIIVDKATNAVRRERVAEKRTKLVTADVGGIHEQDVVSHEQRQRCISDEEINQLATLATRIENDFAVPLDIEWVASGGQISIVQARPITTNNQPVAGDSLGSRLKRKLHSLLFEYFPTPLYPFDRSAILSLLGCTLETLAQPGLQFLPPEHVLSLHQSGAIRPFVSLPRLRWSMPFCFLTFLLRLVQGIFQSPSQFYSHFVPYLAAQLKALPTSCDRLSDDELQNTLRKAMALRDSVFTSRSPYFWMGWVSIVVLQGCLHLLHRDRWSNVYFSLTEDLDLPTTRINRDLRDLQELVAHSKRIRDFLAVSDELSMLDDPEIATFRDTFVAFLAKHGSRTPDLIPLPSRQTWSDAPVTLLTMLRDSAAQPSKPAIPKPQDSWTPDRLPFPVRPLVQKLVSYVREMTLERDYVIRAYEDATVPIRAAMRVLGSRLAARELIRLPNDVRFLEIAEAFAALNSGQPSIDIVQTRKLARPMSLANWDRPRRTATRNAGSCLVLDGLAASPGIHTGTAVVLNSEKDFARLKCGDILVCVASNPSWTPLFSKAGALVTDLGGPLSHAAIVAREFGIPAVLNTEHATSTLISGETYTVDGTKGHVLSGSEK